MKILFFAQLREQLNCDSLEISGNQLACVADVHQKLMTDNPQWATYLGDHKLLVAVNQTLVKFDHPIVSDDEIAFFPPVTGG